jgi:hypothetical protein
MISTITALSRVLLLSVMNSRCQGIMTSSTHVMTTVNVITVAKLWILWSSFNFFFRPFLGQMCQSNWRLSIRLLLWHKFHQVPPLAPNVLNLGAAANNANAAANAAANPAPPRCSLLFQEHSLKLLSRFYVN